MTLAVVETHPIQYHAPVYRALQQRYGVAVTAIYGSDFSVAGYRDAEFGVSFKWDTDLLGGYSSTFLGRVAEGGAADVEGVTAVGLRAALARVRPSAVLIVGYSPRFHRIAWREAWRTGSAILFRGETSDGAVGRNWVKQRVRDAALAAAYRTCARLLYIGQASRAHFLRLGVPESRLVFSPYCVDPAPFASDEPARARLRLECRRELGLRDTDVAVLFSGKLSPRKGVDLLLTGVKQLPPRLRDRTVVVWLGDGEEREALDTAATQAPAVRVRFVGFQNQHALSRFYHAADVLVLPSRAMETWGLVVNEALAHGVPCVVSDRVGAAPDLIREGITGSVCQAESAAAVAEALVRVVPLVSSEATRAACRAQVARYSVDAAAEGLAIAFASATQARRAG